METVYYIDSENVGDAWIELMENTENPDVRFVIFYTEHSPRIAYSKVVKLMDITKKLKFIECREGNNALDFQLVSYLGYELHTDVPKEMIIVSNDTGFDSVVLFWQECGMNLKRLPISNSNSKPIKTEPVLDDFVVTDNASIKMTEKICDIDEKEIYTIINCVGKENLSYIHLVFLHLYGNETGKKIYKYMKTKKFDVPIETWNKKTRIKKLVELIINYSKFSAIHHSENLAGFIVNNIEDKKGNMLNKFKKAYGETTGSYLHMEFRPFYKMFFMIKNK